MKKLSFVDKIIYLVNSLAAVLLLLSYLLPYVSPKSVALFAILSLFVPFLLIINIVFFIYWLVKLKKQFFTSLIVLVIGWFIATSFYKFSAKNNALNNDIKVMSYNVRMFNHWKWTEKKDIPEKIREFIKNENPDILAVQENMSLPKYKLDFPYSYIKRKYTRGKAGASIYSKFQIINSGFIELKDTGNSIIFADIIKQKDTIRVYNIHLQSLKIKPEEENFGEENSTKLIKNLKENFKKQAEQVNAFLQHEKKWIGKLILCGDFNNTAYSWVYKQLTQNKKDAFLEAGKGFGKTFKYWFPMRIDYILTDENAEVNQFKNYSESYSDHYPISTRVNW